MQLKILLFFCYIFCFSYGLAAVLNDEVSALLSIKAGLIDPLNKLQDWKLQDKAPRKDAAHCNWVAVSCNAAGAVEKLDLSHMNLSGRVSDEIQKLKSLSTLNLCCNGFSTTLPKSVANLTTLRSLDVSQNFFVGDFPLGLGKASRLMFLNASGNDFSGFLPEDLGNASFLETLDLRGSFSQGSIPKSFSRLQKLKFLGLSGNNLTAEIPGDLGQLSSLEYMILGYNSFEGGIPREFGNLTNLKYLDMAEGNLGGEIPDGLGNLKLLNTVFLYRNNFKGRIPPSLGNLTSLVLMDFSDNMLSGKIPPEIGQLKHLELLNFMSNLLSGPVPSEIGDLPQLKVLELWNNSLSGTLPNHLGKSSPLQWLDVSSNSLSGVIPETLCSQGNLTKLILFSNAFTGPIPINLSSCPSLVRVRIHNNLLNGTIPVGFGKLGNLERLELANNSLTGEIPNDISSSTSLSFIDFSRNSLHSSLPSTILSTPNLQSFLVSHNNLGGEIPDQFQDCPSLGVLDLSSNHLSGSIPASVASCQKLVNLNLKNNQLIGKIPKALGNMPSLAILDFSNNSLTGEIPDSFGISPALEALNVSYNRLEGPVPTNGLLRTINPSDLVGNAGLCGGVLPPCGQNSAYALEHGSSRAKHIITGWVIGISLVLVVGIALFVVRSIYIRWYSHGFCFGETIYKGDKRWPWRLMAFQRLNFTSAEILACIKETNVIGMGATGVVYMAEISQSNTIVAVKKLWKSGSDTEVGNSDNLVGEVNLLGRLRHRNIVRLLGYLYNDVDVMIVYEFMSNGNLGDALHGKHAVRLLVDWASRYKIALGVAQGLAYLHHDCHPPVIHRDIKSNNILLDANLEARIADFGLAKMMIRKNETVSMIAGSYGYIAPEYGYTLKVDEKIDTYSYGVVLLELLTGKRPLDSEFGESVDIVEWIKRKIRDNKPLEEALDPSVGNCRHVVEEMLLVLRIALLCTAKLPKDRPSMKDVIMILEEAKPRSKSDNNDKKREANNKMPVFSTSSPISGLV
ncbi:hypothetical protein K1719_032225 [Acacia pycnantha]|nr:hypothetical protein K1719_032225 [Acacia pycnantha]